MTHLAPLPASHQALCPSGVRAAKSSGGASSCARTRAMGFFPEWHGNLNGFFDGMGMGMSVAGRTGDRHGGGLKVACAC